MIEVNNTTKYKINLARTKKIVEAFLHEYKQKNKEVSLALVGSRRMKKLNNDYRGVNKTTDVLSFGAELAGGKKNASGGKEKYLGEVIINTDEVKKANKYLEVFGFKKSAEYIFYFLLIHGLLHLMGFNDEKEVERLKMIRRGEEFLEEHL